MKKVIVIGSGGAGKSTFSNSLGEKLGIEVIHLDRLYWRPNWVETPKDEWIETVRQHLGRDSWIIDGNYGGTREMRLQACDTVIFLDIPRRVCLYRILKRAVVYHGRSRPDMAEGCNEKIDLEFILWIWNYPNDARKRVTEQLECFPEKTVIVLRSTHDIESFLQKL